VVPISRSKAAKKVDFKVFMILVFKGLLI